MAPLEDFLRLGATLSDSSSSSPDDISSRAGYDTASDPSSPHASTTLQVNLVFRVTLAFLTSIVCWVPLRLLYKNGEFATTVLILTVLILNLLTIVDSLLWPNDDVASWWTGDVWCDLHNYVYSPLLLVYTGCVLAIMRNLARQLGSLRASSLTSRERARRALGQALVIFPLPLVQLAWIYPLATQRYGISSLVGCFWISDPTWPYVVFFVIPPPLIAVVTAYYAVVTYLRFRQVQKQTRTAFSSSSGGGTGNQLAAARANRAERRLFYMALSILIPYLPLTIYFSIDNLISSLPLRAYNFSAAHNPETWWLVPPVTSDQVGFAFQNVAYIPILTAIPIFWFFGLTKDAVNTYRRYLLVVGVGRLFPRLYQEYDPDARLYATGSSSKWSSGQRTGVSDLPHIDSLTTQKDMTIDTFAKASPIASGIIPSGTTPTPPPPSPPQSRLSKLSWTLFGFGHKKSQFENLSSEDLAAAASHRPGPLSRFGATTNHLNSVVMQPYPPHSNASSPSHSPSSSPAPYSTTASPAGSTAASPKSTPYKTMPGASVSDNASANATGGWATTSTLPSSAEVQTRVWSGDERAGPAAADDSDASDRSGGGVVVTRSIASKTEHTTTPQ
jgi:pheromone a factor receptor